MDMIDLQNALQILPADQREALILTSASGLSYEETAVICNCAVGTVKSRVSRAREKLAELLQLNAEDDFDPSRQWRAALSNTRTVTAELD